MGGVRCVTKQRIYEIHIHSTTSGAHKFCTKFQFATALDMLTGELIIFGGLNKAIQSINELFCLESCTAFVGRISIVLQFRPLSESGILSVLLMCRRWLVNRTVVAVLVVGFPRGTCVNCKQGRVCS